MANDIVKDATAKEAMIARGSNYSSKQARMDKDEKELEELMKAQYGTEEDEVEQVEEKVTEEPVVETKEVESEEEEEESDEKLSREEKSFKKRYGDLRRHMAEKEKEWKDKLESVESEGPLRAPKSDEDIEEWASKYPDVAAIVETIASKKADEKFAVAEGRLREFDEANDAAERSKAETAIRKAHGDFDELRDSDSFHDWVEEQPKWVRDALYENSDDAASVVRVIDLYKVDNDMTPSARKTKAKDAAKSVTKRSRTAVDDTGLGSMLKESTVSKMTDKEFEDRYDEIQEAMSTGKFVYDISGKAR
tara:strand:+ start:7382 stop:8302 length:921 start_codon:yes stop_codon:yes gene_type:complete